VEFGWLLIDFVNGYLLHKGITLGGQSLGSLIRLGIFVLCFYTLLRRYRFQDNYYLITFIVIILLTFFHGFYSQDQVANYMQNVTKVLFSILFFYVVRVQIELNHLNRRTFKYIIFCNAVVLLANVYLTFLGIGYSNYGETAEGDFKGGTGFFFAGNEVAGTMISLFILFLLISFERKIVWVLLASSVFVVGSILLISKTSIFGSLIILSIYLLYRANLKQFIKLLPFFAVLLIVIGVSARSYLEFALERWQYMSNAYDAVTYYLGGQKRFTAIDVFLQTLADNPLKLLTGSGWSGECENGFFDLVEAYGVWGVSVYLIWLHWITSNARVYLRYRYNEIALAASGLFLMAGISVFAGHVVQSAMQSIFIAMIANFGFFTQRNKIQLVVA